MLHAPAAEVFARHRQEELREVARQVRVARELRSLRSGRVRARFGWWLAHAGIHLAARPRPGSAPVTPPATASTVRAARIP
jgi:hypothetical protein